MVAFEGEYRHNLDSKNRLIIPSKFREQLNQTVHVTVWLDGCLAAFADEEWSVMKAKIDAMPKTNPAARALSRRIVGKASECQVDNQGRILLTAAQIKNVGIVKECVLLGVSDHFEIWPEDRYDSYDDASAENFEDNAASLGGLF